MAVTGDILVIEPTGNVGSAVVSSLAERKFNGKVFLAMRDTSKPIPGFDESSLTTPKFERVHADLAKPETVKEAATKTGATRAFMYVLMDTRDHMRAAVQALYDGGIRFVVVLSSVNISFRGNPKGDRGTLSPQEDYVAWVHGGSEQNILDIMGPRGMVSLRTGWHNANSRLWLKPALSGLDVPVPFPESKGDWVAEDDIGSVGAYFLVLGEQTADVGFGKQPEYVYVIGPDQPTLGEGILIVAKAFGKVPKIVPVEDVLEGTKVLVSLGVPEAAAQQLSQELYEAQENPESLPDHFKPKLLQPCVKRSEVYLGRPAMTLSQWAEKQPKAMGM